MRFSNYVEGMRSDGTAEVMNAWQIHGEARRRQRLGEDIILLSIGDHDFATDSRIVAACCDALHAERHHYTAALGELASRQAAVRFHDQIIGEQISVDNVAIVPGAQSGVFTTAMALLDAGDEVICFDPMYVTYSGALTAPHAKMRFVTLRPENDFQPTTEDIRAAITPKTKAIMLNTPNNPTGAVTPPWLLEEIADIAETYDLWVISDEVYCTMTYERAHLSPRRIKGLADRTVALYSLSKSFAMTGWRMGWVVAHPEVIKRLDLVLSSLLFGTPTFIQDAMVGAINDAFDETGRIRELYRRRRDVICGALAKVPKIKFSVPEAGMFLMLDVRETGVSSIEFARSLLAEQNVSLLPGEGFGASQAGFLRLSYCVDEAQLAVAAGRIAAHVTHVSVSG